MHLPTTKKYCYSVKLNQLHYSMKAAQTRRTYFEGITEEMERANERAKQRRLQNKNK